MAKKRDERAAAEKAIADAVKSHKDGDGMVRVYPIAEDAGRVERHPAEPHDVEPAEAVELLLMRPPSFTLYESGNPLKEHAALDELDMAQAWSAADLVEASVVIEVQPPAEPVHSQEG
ncbi:MAG TPA: hypothetical protein VFJ93_07645 [Gaiellaceae bacterium]|nr:hypothetical protein [Gaiellaceae bacterium]